MDALISFGSIKSHCPFLHLFSTKTVSNSFCELLTYCQMFNMYAVYQNLKQELSCHVLQSNQGYRHRKDIGTEDQGHVQNMNCSYSPHINRETSMEQVELTLKK
jgi:hypothetical protein